MTLQMEDMNRTWRDLLGRMGCGPPTFWPTGHSHLGHAYKKTFKW